MLTLQQPNFSTLPNYLNKQWRFLNNFYFNLKKEYKLPQIQEGDHNSKFIRIKNDHKLVN